MSNNSPFSRRGLLRLGIIGGILGAVGCGDSPSANTVTTPPVEGGNRSRLKTSEEKSELLKDKQQKKKR